MSALVIRNCPFATLLLAFWLAGCESGQNHVPARVATVEGSPSTWAVEGRSDSGLQVRMEPLDGKPALNKFQSWHLIVTDSDDQPVSQARITIGGGMPGHGHGMPTQPQVTRALGEGRFLVEGIKFNMAGDWQFTVIVESAKGTSRLILPFALGY